MRAGSILSTAFIVRDWAKQSGNDLITAIGNGAIIGSMANIIVASLSEKTRDPITSALWNRRGLPVMILAWVVASEMYAIFFPWFTASVG